MKMTMRRKDVLAAFKAIEKDTKLPPSLSMVAEVCGVTSSTVHEHAKALFDAGLLKRTKYGGTNQNPYFKYHAADRCPTCGAKT